MLVLTRRSGEVVQVGDFLKVTILSIKGKKVRVGFDAPKNIHVDREEVVAHKREARRLLRETDAVGGEDD